MTAQIIEFPFNSGAYEAADREWLPSNMLATVENMRLDLDGRLGVRPGFTALGTSTYSSGTLTAYDLANYAGRLVALGDQTSAGRATDLFEFVNGVATWRATAAEDASVTGARMPRAVQARQVGRIPDQVGQVKTAQLAATPGGLIAVAADTVGPRAVFHLFNPTTNQTVVLTNRAISLARVVQAGNNLWLVGVNASNNIVGFVMNPATDKTLGTQVTLSVVGSAITDLAITTFGASGFAVGMINAGIPKVRTYNTNGGATASWDATANQATCVAIAGNTAGTQVTAAWGESLSHQFFASTFNSSGTLVNGPTRLFGSSENSSIDRRLGARIQSNSICFVGSADKDPIFGVLNGEFETVTQILTQSTHAVGTTNTYRNSLPASLPIYMVNGSTDEFYYGAVDYFSASLSPARGSNQLVERSTRLLQAFSDPQRAPQIPNVALGVNTLNGTATIGTKLYWANVIATSDTGNSTEDTTTFTVTEVQMTDTGRRQMASVANELHIAGALPLVYDGQGLWEHGFAEKPIVFSATLGGTAGGSKTLLGVYNVVAVWEVTDAKGRILRSQPSDPATITLTGTNQTLSASATTPHSLRTNFIFQNTGNYAVRLSLYSTIAGGANFFLDHQILIDPNTVDMYAPIAFTLTQSDKALSDNLVLYTQSQTPIPHNSPPSYQFTWPTRERQLIGGTTITEQFTHSKLLFPGEPVEFAPAGRLGFTGSANQDVTAVAAFETSSIVFTKAEIGQVTGRGPEQNGTGDFDSFTLIPSPGGCIEWRSLVSTPDGLFFQMLREKLMILQRGQYGGGGKVDWVGKGIQQTLALFPVITAACYIRSQTQILVAFSAQNVAGNDGRILIYDSAHDSWYVDTIGPVAALAELDGRLAYVLSGAVSYQDAAPGNGAFPTCKVDSGVIPITKRLGWGRLYKVGLLGNALGACTVECFVDYDDGNGFVSQGQLAFAGTEGQFERFWSLSVQKTARFAVRFVVTGGSNTLGLRLNAWALEVEGSPNMVRVGSTGQVA